VAAEKQSLAVLVAEFDVLKKATIQVNGKGSEGTGECRGG